MKIRIMKKYAQARHTYGFGKRAMAFERKELFNNPGLIEQTSLRSWTNAWYRARKVFSKRTGFRKRDYYAFYSFASKELGRKIIEARKRDPYYEHSIRVYYEPNNKQ